MNPVGNSPSKALGRASASAISNGMNIAVIDYGASNLRSVANALVSLGQSFEIVTSAEKLAVAKKVILPGVGAAGSAMRALREKGFASAVPKLSVPVLGICLGLQLFADSSEEDATKGLGILPGAVRRFKTELKVPHMGWNKVRLAKDSLLTRGIPDGSFFYFVHSYYLDVEQDFIIGKTTYDVDFAAIAQKGNFYGTQFHPEKSAEAGMKILDNFCRLC